MKFNIRDIGTGGVRAAGQLGASEVLALLQPEGVALAGDQASARYTLALSRVEATVTVRGSLEGEFLVTCSRCLGTALIRLDEPELLLTFLPRPAPGPGAEDAFVDDVGTWGHDGEIIDLAPVVRELLILAIPMVPLCHPECQGICTGCGVDLNQEACRCPAEQTPASPWAQALVNLKR